MPRDAKGNFHMNTQRAIASDKRGGALGAAMGSRGKKPPSGGGIAVAAQEAEPSSVHEHLSALHSEMGGKHMHIHSDEMGNHTTHQVGEDGQVQGPHEHPDTEALKAHIEQFLNEEEHEGMSGHSAEHGMATGRIKDVY